MLERDCTKVGDSSFNPEKSKIEEGKVVEREVVQMKDIIEPS